MRPVRDFADRVVRDRRYKLWVKGGEPTRLFDLKANAAETKNLVDSNVPAAVAALKRLSAVVESFPKTDARPKYDPTPSQPWDRKTDRKKNRRKKPTNDRRKAR